MDVRTSLRIQRRGLADFIKLLGASSAGARVYERNGVLGAIVPACPVRSLANSIVYEDAAGLAASLDDVGAAYEGAGVKAWLVWVPEFDGEAIAALDAAGYRHDGSPAAMHADLAAVPVLDPGDLDWDDRATPAEVGAVNDAAYGLPPDAGFSHGIVEPAPVVPTRFYRARVGGEVACIVGTMDHDEDLGIYLVATAREHRGQGLTPRLMQVAFAEARERGLRTTSLQASKMGEPVYERLGYRTVMRLQLWERRSPAEE